MPTVAAESSAEMTEEEEDEENNFFVEELPRKLKAFRDGSLLVYEVKGSADRIVLQNVSIIPLTCETIYMHCNARKLMSPFHYSFTTFRQLLSPLDLTRMP